MRAIRCSFSVFCIEPVANLRLTSQNKCKLRHSRRRYSMLHYIFQQCPLTNYKRHLQREHERQPLQPNGVARFSGRGAAEQLRTVPSQGNAHARRELEAHDADNEGPHDECAACEVPLVRRAHRRSGRGRTTRSPTRCRRARWQVPSCRAAHSRFPLSRRALEHAKPDTRNNADLLRITESL